VRRAPDREEWRAVVEGRGEAAGLPACPSGLGTTAKSRAGVVAGEGARRPEAQYDLAAKPPATKTAMAMRTKA
jgi:hypothetical protein